MTNNVSGVMFDGNDPPPDIKPGGAMPNSSAWEYQYEVFYVSKDPDPVDAPPQLSRRVLSGNDEAMELQTEELTEGVENLRCYLALMTMTTVTSIATRIQTASLTGRKSTPWKSIC